jgi:hypothetical protein
MDYCIDLVLRSAIVRSYYVIRETISLIQTAMSNTNWTRDH